MPEASTIEHDDDNLLSLLLTKFEAITERLLVVENNMHGDVPKSSRQGRRLTSTVEDRVAALEGAVQTNTDEIAVNSRLVLHTLQ
jgi:hypothetical protein